jgi:hypothetical protein
MTAAAMIVPGYGMCVCIQLTTHYRRIHVMDFGGFGGLQWLGWAAGRDSFKEEDHIRSQPTGPHIITSPYC